MAVSLNPGLLRDLIESKAAVARHGIVLLRSVESDLAPLLVSQARDSMAASPRKLAQMSEDELDRYVQRIRKRAMKASDELADLYRRLLSRLGTENLIELQEDLEGIGQLFSWDRIAKAGEDVNDVLSEKGFAKVELGDPSDLSEDFAIELSERWPAAFSRFSSLAKEAAQELKRQEESPGPAHKTRQKKPTRRG